MIPKGYILIQNYPGQKKSIGYYEEFTTGYLSNFPNIWRPVYFTKSEYMRNSKIDEILNQKLNQKLKIGLDFHGVIDSNPTFFSSLSNMIVKDGGEVHIITGGSWSDSFEEQLSNFGIAWTHKFSVYDHLVDIDTPTVGEYQFPDGEVQKRFVDGHWDRVKADYCKENKISLHFDDTLIYNDFFETPFCRYWSHNGQKKSEKKDIRHID